MSLDERVELQLKALEFFKDWSNYLLVTTVVALGWVASGDSLEISRHALWYVVGSFGFSIVFGIFTLALIPLIAEGIDKSTKSFYDVVATFDLIWFMGPRISCKLKWVCWVQHVLFLAGILIFTLSRMSRL